MNNDLESVYQQTWKVITELSTKHNPSEVAGVLIAQGLTLYKTFLSEQDYNSMVDAISNSRDQVKTLNLPELQ
jgi:uncharacterized SAM-dependent methyltransferase